MHANKDPDVMKDELDTVKLRRGLSLDAHLCFGVMSMSFGIARGDLY